jgi:PadR family transcriptional regulator
MLSKTPNALLHGALDALILKTLARGPSHGYAVARFIEETTGDAVLVEEGSLYPALYRLERRGWKPNGARLSLAGGRSCTASPSRAATNSPPRWPSGGGSPPASQKSCSPHEALPSFVAMANPD